MLLRRLKNGSTITRSPPKCERNGGAADGYAMQQFSGHRIAYRTLESSRRADAVQRKTVRHLVRRRKQEKGFNLSLPSTETCLESIWRPKWGVEGKGVYRKMKRAQGGFRGSLIFGPLPAARSRAMS